MNGLFITFEGTEGSGKSTQIALLAKRLQEEGRIVRTLREPGGTPIGEEIRYTLKHSDKNQAMTPEAELLLMNASRAQLVQEIIRPALKAGEIVLCDRFYHSTLAYQGYGRGLNLKMVETVIDIAVGETRPDLTLLLMVPVVVSEARRSMRQSKESTNTPPIRDRMEEADRSFFERVERGYRMLAKEEPNRIHSIDATKSLEEVTQTIWKEVSTLFTSMKKIKAEH